MKHVLTDCTLACLDGYDAASSTLRTMLLLLAKLPVQAIEMSILVYEKIQCFAPFPPGRDYFLHVEDLQQVKKYPGFDGYILLDKSIKTEQDSFVELNLHGWRTQRGIGPELAFRRLCGCGDLMGIDAKRCFEDLLKKQPDLELMPGNSLGMATALAVEFCLMGGRAATTFAGIGRHACTEEVLLALYLAGAMENLQSLAQLQQVQSVFEQITGEVVSAQKPVLGKHIFAVEAGIHVDGILKDPRLYEPYPPRFVGLERNFVMGKHSGRQAVLAKLEEMGLDFPAQQVSELLVKVQEKSIEKQTSLSDAEFLALVKGVKV
jgi:homocitrate synthase NifV